MRIYTAKHVLPISAPPIAEGAVAVHDGRIVAVGRRKDVQKSVPGATPVEDLGEAVILPGLVNAHVHLELSFLADPPLPEGDYMAWVRRLVQRRETSYEPLAARAAAESAVRRLVSRGTVAVGDVGNQDWIAGTLARSSLRGIAFLEILGFRAAEAERILDEAAARLDRIEAEPELRSARDRLRVALTPHAPHTLSPALLKALAGRSAAAQQPLSIHVAESTHEAELVRDGKGPMAELLRERGMDEPFRATGHSPVEHLDRLGVLSPRTLAVHCVHIDHQDLSRLQTRGVTVVTCPRSNAWLGVGKAPVPRLLASGIPVALGTDSLASAPSLDLFEELAFLRKEHPELSPAAALRMATLNGARALSLGKDLGSIEPGKLALLLVVPLSAGDDPQESVTCAPATVLPLPLVE